MHLIDVNTLNLKYFTTCPVGKYAILSHTWEEGEELDFQSFSRGEGRGRIGWKKIEYCCEQAREDGYEYAWIDTCCINKESSAELSEAINSMYAWYKQAGICYAYLADIKAEEAAPDVMGRSRWFTRGWTLQELIAPSEVIFYDVNWRVIGTRTGLASRIERITRIEIEILEHTRDIGSCSIAQRMSWASTRVTTRVEDLAYCLLGMFNVSIPLLYGEGIAAFTRLQEEIIKTSDDESIFAWSGVPPQGSGLLAKSPANFKHSGNIRNIGGQPSRPVYHMTSRGLEIEVELTPVHMNTYAILLQCHRCEPHSKPQQLSIYICRTTNDIQYLRGAVNQKDLLTEYGSGRWSGPKCQKRTILVDGRRIKNILPYGKMPIICSSSRWNHDNMSGLEHQVQSHRSPSAHLVNELSRFADPVPLALTTSYTAYRAWLSGKILKFLPLHTTVNQTDYRGEKEVQLPNMFWQVYCLSSNRAMQFALRIGFTFDFEPVCYLGDVVWRYSSDQYRIENVESGHQFQSRYKICGSRISGLHIDGLVGTMNPFGLLSLFLFRRRMKFDIHLSPDINATREQEIKWHLSVRSKQQALALWDGQMVALVFIAMNFAILCFHFGSWFLQKFWPFYERESLDILLPFNTLVSSLVVLYFLFWKLDLLSIQWP